MLQQRASRTAFFWLPLSKQKLTERMREWAKQTKKNTLRLSSYIATFFFKEEKKENSLRRKTAQVSFFEIFLKNDTKFPNEKKMRSCNPSETLSFDKRKIWERFLNFLLFWNFLFRLLYLKRGHFFYFKFLFCVWKDKPTSY